jgi:hypothetical protein
MQSPPQMHANARETSISIPLAERIIELIKDSGATQVEALCALGVVRSVMPTLNIRAVSRD